MPKTVLIIAQIVFCSSWKICFFSKVRASNGKTDITSFEYVQICVWKLHYKVPRDSFCTSLEDEKLRFLWNGSMKYLVIWLVCFSFYPNSMGMWSGRYWLTYMPSVSVARRVLPYIFRQPLRLPLCESLEKRYWEYHSHEEKLLLT